MKKIVLLLALLLSNFFANAQELDKEKYKQLVDYMCCICINDALGNSSVDCEKTSISKNDIPDTDTRTLDLFKEFQKLKDAQTGNELTVKFLTGEVFNSSKYEKIKGFAKKREDGKINDIINRISEKANSLTTENSVVKENNYKTSDSIDNQSPDTESASNDVSESINDLSIYPKTQEYGVLDFMKDYGFSSVLFILFIIFFIYQKQRNFASIERVQFMINENEKKEFTNKPNYSTNSSSQNRLVEDKIKSLEDKIKSLESEVKSLKDIKIQSEKDVLSPVVTFEVPKTPIVTQEDEIFYRHAPHESGYFDTDNDVNLNDAVFKFVINKNNPDLASFEIIKNQKKLILDYPNKYIKPVCDELNALNQNASNIFVTSGTVEKRNNQWVVKSKATIKYE